MKQLVLDSIEDLVSDLLYYYRKEDEELPEGEIESLLENGELTIDEMVNAFRAHLESNLNE